MEFIHLRTEMRVKRTVNIIDGPEIPYPDSSVAGRRVLLTKVDITYVLVSGSWVVDRWGGGELMIHGEGWTLKQNGARSQRRWSGQVPTAPQRTEGAWLKKLVDGARPTGIPGLPFDLTEV
jgi:hypothetical protein